MGSPGLALGLSQIGQIAVTVEDVERAARFYRDALGLRLLFQVPNMAFFDCGGIRLMLGLPEKPDAARHSSIVYFRVEDIQATHQALASREVAFVGPPHLVAKMKDHDLWLAFFRDGEGNVMALMSEVRGG
jgi:methylmalonyl-CoA/ethylmalonyl-CoA epimerase